MEQPHTEHDVLIIDQTHDFPGEGWCCVIVHHSWCDKLPIAVFADPEQARGWLEENKSDHGRYTLYATPLSLVPASQEQEA